MNKVNRIIKKDGKITKTQVDAPTPVYNVRIKPEVYERLAVIAAQEGRSATAQINFVLERSLQSDKK